jgi:hypothetical protein
MHSDTSMPPAVILRNPFELSCVLHANPTWEELHKTGDDK